MTSRSESIVLEPRELADYGLARARDLAFDAVQTLWRRRSAAGMKQSDLAKKIGRDTGWVSRNLRGPANWTLRTLGELVQGLDGELDIVVHGIEDSLSPHPNYHAYAGYELLPNQGTRPSAPERGIQVIGPSAPSGPQNAGQVIG